MKANVHWFLYQCYKNNQYIQKLIQSSTLNKTGLLAKTITNWCELQQEEIKTEKNGSKSKTRGTKSGKFCKANSKENNNNKK